MIRKKLPIGIQTFREIREDGCYYVDKTSHILRLVTEGKYYFLSRPRRFGKSLLIDTIAELFAGNQPLFQGLYIHDRWDWLVRFPVVRISFGGGVLRSREALDRRIVALMRANQRALGIACDPRWEEDPADCFGQLLAAAHEQHGQRAVVLVDEYDKPILDNLDQPEVARQMREGLRNLYSVIKDSDAHVKFALLTGVSKFSKVSIFSGLNNLQDITLDHRYSALCGYTEADVETVFAPELPRLDRQKIRDWYNGYNWLGESVYNPFDLLLFSNRSFRPWWFETGTPTFLIELLMERRFFTPELGCLQTDLDLLSSFDVDDISPDGLLFQSGYLTIAEVQERGERTGYVLGYPNREVQISLNERITRALTAGGRQQIQQLNRLYDLLLVNDFPGLQALFTAFYSSIPHAWYDNSRIADYEGFYASVFYSYFASLGLRLICEDISSKGRIDMTLDFNGQWYLFEFKVVEETPEGRALAQIKARNYAAKYAADGRPIHLIGVEFSKASRSVAGFEVEAFRS